MTTSLASVVAADVEARAQQLRERLDRLGASGVTVVAVTKGFDRSAVDAALGCGFEDLGENYAQELIGKVEAGSPDAPRPRWHMIGRLQRNKVRALAPHVTLWQSVDRLELGREIAKHAPTAHVLVQVNISGEEQKGGCPPEEVGRLVEALGDLGLTVRGLMAVGPTGPPAAALEPFRRVVAIADDLGLPIRSIGMSADLDVAIAAGSTMVRVGSALFGPRGPASGVRH